MSRAMTGKSDYEHQFLDLKGDGMEDRTFLGRSQLSTRISLFVVFGLMSLVTLGSILLYVDQRLASAISDGRHAREISALAGRMEAGLARAEALEKTFILDKRSALAGTFSIEIDNVESALDGLERFSETASLRQHMATLRDGVAQYDQRFFEFVGAEEALGWTTETGLSQRLKTTSDALVRGFRDARVANLADQMVRIDREGREMLRSMSEFDATELKERYKLLLASLKTSELSAKLKENLGDLIKVHETDMLTVLNFRFALDKERGRFSDIISYMGPSREAILTYSADLGTVAVRRIDRAQTFSRYMVGGASMAILLWFMFAGMLLLKSVFGPVRALADAAARLANGEHGTPIPARGNVDASGQIARALDKWADDLVDLDTLRRQLEKTQFKMEQVAREAERKAQAAIEAAKANIMADLETRRSKLERGTVEEPPAPSAASDEMPPAPPSIAVYNSTGIGGPISSVSQQLSRFSEYVSVAACGAERTGALVRSLGEATTQIEVLGNLVTAVRDQVNLLASRSSPRVYNIGAPENLIPFNKDERQPEGETDNPVAVGRLDAICETTERAERALQGVKLSVDNISAAAQEIATTASRQAMDATNKLLAQSQYLQNMLDDIMARRHLSEPDRLLGEDPRQDQAQQSQQPRQGMPLERG